MRLLNQELTQTRDFRRKLIYKVSALKFTTRCIECDQLFVGQLPEPTYDLKCPHCGADNDPDHVQRGYRPFLIVQNESYTAPLTTVLAVPITTSVLAKNKIGAVRIPPPIMPEDSYALCWQPRPLNKTNFFAEKKIGEIDDKIMKEVDKWLIKLMALH
ncbi:hypothetical protein SY88_12770 [Clostridiales bacterium PH28_bin88]|nr:hypothetical protein SY88_12770 [Clostridiales bacterium PH28_bin88]